jgi:hypothetical protein
MHGNVTGNPLSNYYKPIKMFKKLHKMKITWVVTRVITGGATFNRKLHPNRRKSAVGIIPRVSQSCEDSGPGDRWPHQQRTAGDTGTGSSL